MKKLLALVLALVMTMGLATVGTSAAFADAASIEHSEAVEVLNALGVVGGKENNNFDPTANVKRSEMAKMVTIAMLGDVDVSAFAGAPTDLTDINGHWAEGYIKYCYSQGIIGGRGNGKFDPDANVTATEAAKMLLVAIGYSAEVQGYGGDQWKVNVARDAQLSGFYTDLKGLTVDKALTRDETAQLVYNAMDADLIVKKPTLNVSTGTIQYTYEKNTNKEDLLGNIFKAYSVEGRLDKFTYASKDAKWTLTIINTTGNAQTGVKGFTGDTFNDNAQQSFDSTTDYTDLYKQNVKVLYAVDKNNNIDKALGVYPTSDDQIIVTHVVGKIDNAKSTATTLRVDGKDYDLTNRADQTSIYEFKYNNTAAYSATVHADTIIGGYVDAATAANVNSDTVRATYLFRLIDNTGDGKGDVIVTFPQAIAKVSSVSANSLTLSYQLAEKAFGATTTAKLADIDAYAGIAKGDYVIVTAATNTSTNTMKLEKATVQSGTVSATKDKNEQIDGSWLRNDFVERATAGDSVNYIAYNGFLAWQEGASATGAEKFVFVLGFATDNDNKLDNTYTAKLLFSDGSKKTVEVTGVNGATKSVAGLSKGRMYAYDTKDGNYNLYDVYYYATGSATYVTGKDTANSSAKFKIGYDFLTTAGGNPTSTYVYAGTTGTSTSFGTVDTTGTVARVTGNASSLNSYNGKTFTVADDAVIFVYASGKDVAVTTGAQLKKVTSGNVTDVLFFAGNNNSSTGYGEIKVAYVVTGSGISTKGNYAFATSDVRTVKSGDKYYAEVDVWNGTAMTTLKTAEKSTTTEATGLLTGVSNKTAFEYSLNASGVIADPVTVGGIGGTKGLAVESYEAGSMISLNTTVVYKATDTALTYFDVAATYTYVIDSDTEIFYVNLSDSPVSGSTSGEVTLANKQVFTGVNGGEATFLANATIIPGTGSDSGKAKLIVVDIAGDMLGVSGS